MDFVKNIIFGILDQPIEIDKQDRGFIKYLLNRYCLSDLVDSKIEFEKFRGL